MCMTMLLLLNLEQTTVWIVGRCTVLSSFRLGACQNVVDGRLPFAFPWTPSLPSRFLPSRCKLIADVPPVLSVSSFIGHAYWWVIVGRRLWLCGIFPSFSCLMHKFLKIFSKFGVCTSIQNSLAFQNSLDLPTLIWPSSAGGIKGFFRGG